MKEILCFGDSNTYGLVPGKTTRYTREQRLAGKLEEKFNSHSVRIVEEGLCGRTADFEDSYRIGRKGTSILPVILDTHYPLNGVVIMLGTNDCKSVYQASPEKIGEGIEKLVLQVKEKDSRIPILIISPIFLGESVWQEGFDIEFNKESVEVSKGLKTIYKDIAEKYNCEFLAASDYASPSTIDQEHIDEEGHENLAEAVYKKISKTWVKEELSYVKELTMEERALISVFG